VVGNRRFGEIYCHNSTYGQDVSPERPYPYTAQRTTTLSCYQLYMLHFLQKELHLHNKIKITAVTISQHEVPVRGAGSSVGIAIGYGMDGPGIESRWGAEIFRTCPDRPWGPPSLLHNGCRVFPGGRKRPGRDADHSSLLVPRSKNRVELYLYST
jgi:hypothetical protein